MCGLAVSTAKKGGTYFQEGTVYATTYDKFEGVMGTKIVYHSFHNRLGNASHLSLSLVKFIIG